MPAICRAGNDELLLAYATHWQPIPPAGGCVKLMRSADDGGTWSRPKTIVRPKDAKTWSVHMWSGLHRMPDGSIILAYGQNRSEDIAEAYVIRTMDHGKTWSEPVRLAADPVSWAGQTVLVPFTEGFGRPVTARNGDVLVPIGCRNGGGFYGNKASAFVRTGDNGTTWSRLEFIASGPEKFSETSMAVAGNGDIVAIIRCDTTRRVLWQSVSHDNGRTWSTPARTRLRGDRCMMGKMPDMLTLPSGRLLLAVGSVGIMDGSEMWGGGPGSSYSGLFVSDDNGKTWRKDVMFVPADPKHLVPYDAPVLALTRRGDVLALTVQGDRRTKDDPRAGWTMGSHYVINVIRQQRRPELVMVALSGHLLTGNHPDRFSPDDVRAWVTACDEMGVTRILWRGAYVGKATYHSRVLPMMEVMEEGYFEKAGVFEKGSYRRVKWEPIRKTLNHKARLIQRFDVLDVALAEAKKRGISFYADLALFDMYFPGLENDFFEDHPEYYVLARDQKTPYRAIPCYAEKAVQEYRLAEIKELLARGVDGISFGLESHYCGAGVEAPDSFGFNAPVVQAFRDRYGIDILKDDFDADKLCALNGEIFTAFLRRVRELLGPQRKMIAAVTLKGWHGYGGPVGQALAGERNDDASVRGKPCYRFDLEWETWIRDGIADGLIVYAPMPDAVERVQRTVKSKLTKGDVFLWREIWQDKRFDAYRDEIAAIRAGAIDGYAVDELNQFLPYLSSLDWRKCRQLLSGLR